jgi:hypothetical protein
VPRWRLLLRAAAALAAAGGSAACAHSPDPKAAAAEHPAGAAPGDLADHAVTSGSVVVFRPSTDKLVTVAAGIGALTQEGTAGQVFQYPWPGRQDLYTSGSSDAPTQFTVVRVTRTSVATILEGPRGVGLFPLASDGDRILLVEQRYDRAGKAGEGTIVELRGLELEPIGEPAAMGISGGAIVGGDLYFSTYDGPGETYTLHRRGLDDPGAPSTVVRGSLRDGRLEVWEGHLVVDGQIDGRPTGVDCDYYCLYSETAGFAVSVEPGSSGDLELRAVDPATGATIGQTSGDVLGLIVSPGGVDVYATGVAPVHIAR